MSTITARIQARRDTAAAWSAANPVLAAGEVGLETDTGILKVGDGAAAWNALAAYSTMDLVPADTQLLLQDGMLEKSGDNIVTKAGSRITGEAVTQSTTDTTVGRMLKVGDGGVIIPIQITTDWNDAISSGLYWAASGVTNQPSGGANFTAIVLRGSNDNNVTQIASAWNVPGAFFYRTRNGGVWSAWGRFYGQGNILGPVSQSGGVPTGAVIERGSNANGEYVRFADGTQICWATKTSLGPATTALGNLFISSQVTFDTMPAAFISAPVRTVSISEGTPHESSAEPAFWLDRSGPNTTQGGRGLIVCATSNAATTFNAHAIWIGRWF